MTVRNAGHGGWALRFHGFLQRNSPAIGCYLSVRKDYAREVRVFEGLKNLLDELPEFEAMEFWENATGLPRIGFHRGGSLAFLSQDEESKEFSQAVIWMREHLNRLVSTLHPRLQSMLADDR